MHWRWEMTSYLWLISFVKNYTDYRSHDTMMTRKLGIFFTHIKWLMLHQGSGKNLSTKETIVVSQDSSKFFRSPVTCGGQRVNWISLLRLPIQNRLDPFITEKRKNKAKYLTRNPIRLTFVLKTSMPNYLESLRYIKCNTAWFAPNLLTALAIYQIQLSEYLQFDQEDLETYWK